MTDQIKSVLEKLRPSVFADAASQAAFRTQLRFADSQWFARERLEQHQLVDLKKLVNFAAEYVPYWRTRLDADAITNAAVLAEALSLLPILSRTEVMGSGEQLKATVLPKGHVVVGELKTSGSTGGVVSIQTTDIAIRLQHVLTLRGHVWARHDFSRSIAAVRRLARGVAEYPGGSEDSHWDSSSTFPFATGRSFQLNTYNASLDQIWDWLVRVRPAYLLTYPSIVQWLAQEAGKRRNPPITLEGITTIGEVVSRELREIAAENFGLRIQDIYSSEEAGCMAINCPDADGYHIQSEIVIVEVLDNDNRPCRAGEVGRVVTTPLFNYAMPLIRYEMGDFAQVGGPCSCGRGLPVLNHIEGRRRNLLTLRDGRRFWPSSGARRMHQLLTIHQHQYRQIALDIIEVLLVTDQPITAERERQLRAVVAESLPGNLEIRICRVPEIPRSAAGKHEEFVSLVS